MPATTESKPLPQNPHRTDARATRSSRPNVNLQRHARKCAICNHPDRELIDNDFVSWRSESTITLDYQLSSRSSVYRHAAATGLLERRRRNLRGVAERIIEQVADVPPSAASVLRALRIFTQITEDGQWIEPTKRSIVTHIHVTHPANERPAEPAAASSSHSLESEGGLIDTEWSTPRSTDPISRPAADSLECGVPLASRTELRDDSAPPSSDSVSTESVPVPSHDSAAASSALENRTSEQTHHFDLDYVRRWAHVARFPNAPGSSHRKKNLTTPKPLLTLTKRTGCRMAQARKF